jgi:hypothetical protein
MYQVGGSSHRAGHRKSGERGKETCPLTACHEIRIRQGNHAPFWVLALVPFPPPLPLLKRQSYLPHRERKTKRVERELAITTVLAGGGGEGGNEGKKACLLLLLLYSRGNVKDYRGELRIT